MHPCRFLTPEDAGFHDIHFFDRTHPVVAFFRKIVRDPADTADFFGRVDLGIDTSALTVGQILDAARFPEIDPTGQFADDQDI